MIERFEIVGSDSPRPDAERIIFCDGAGGRLFRPETDLDLSHWRPNRTPAEYRAGTSTEICYRFLDSPRPGRWTVAVNNHLDVDGILSVYVLVHSEHAFRHRRTIVQAAEMGDFWGWGDLPAQRLFQGLTLLMDRRRGEGADGNGIYAEAFRRIPALIEGTDPDCRRIEESLRPLSSGVELVERGEIRRELIGERCAMYVIPVRIIGTDFNRAAYVPGFNEAISHKALLWPQVRARWDAQRVCLVCVERENGWSYDVGAPGYLWADTENLWILPGLVYGDGMESYELNNAPLTPALEELQQRETSDGRWSVSDGASPFHHELQSIFPVIVRFFDARGEPGRSSLAPDRVGEVIGAAFDGAR